MKNNKNEIIDYEEVFRENNNPIEPHLTEKRSIYSIIIYFVVFFLGFGVLLAQFIANSFMSPYDLENDNAYITNQITENENNVGFVVNNSLDLTENEDLIIIGDIIINDKTYNIVINANKFEYNDWLHNNLANEELLINNFIKNNELRWNDIDTNELIKIAFVAGSDIYNYFIQAYDYSEISSIVIIGDYSIDYNTLLNFLVYVFATIPIFIIFRKEVIYDFKLFKNDKAKMLETIINGFVLMIVLGIGANMLTLLLKTIFKITGDATNQEAINAALQSKTMILMLVTSVFFAPVVEELIFRKAIFSLVKTPKLSIIISSILFSLMHVLSEPNFLHAIINIIPYLTMGIFLGFYYEYKANKNIAVLISIHFLNNLLGALQILLL